MELIQGCNNAAEQKRVEKELARVRTVWPAPLDCQAALALFADRHLSHSLGLLDALIAQTAIALPTPLHTFNVKHYSGIANLRTVQPYTR
jgi:predicted nucleic acid-binding protein